MLEYCDSFEIYTTVAVSAPASQASLSNRWNSFGQGNLTMGVKASPSGPLALYLPFGAGIFKTFSHQSTYTLGFRLNIASVAGVGGATALVDFCNAHQQLGSFRINANGSILVYGNNLPATVICQNATPNIITAGVDCYVEIQMTATDLGTDINIAAQVWVNNTSVASGNANLGINKNTLISKRADFNCLSLNSGVTSNGQAYLWDFYLTNGTGPTNTGRLGSSISPFGVTVQTILPDSDTSTVQWTPLSGTVHFSEINELPADDDASYNSALTSGKIDSYGWQDIPTFVGTVKSVQISLYARSTQEGLAVIKSNIGPAGAEEQGIPIALCSTYLYRHQAFDLNPATGQAWTQPQFNAKAFGIHLT